MEQATSVHLPTPLSDGCSSNCHQCNKKKDPNFILGSAFCTVIVGSFIFLIALAWNEFAKSTFRQMRKCSKEQDQDEDARLHYALLVTSIGILTIFFAMYYIPGTKW